MTLSLKNISLPLASFTLTVDVELRGRVTALFGPSGAGKTSLLDLLAGLRRVDSALIRLDDRILVDTARGISVPARHRGIGYVPQDLALFPHLSVRRNLLYGQKSGPAAAGSSVTLERVLEVLEIGALVDRPVTALSGGERQRVAVARALLSSPRLLLMDEPLANLDVPLRKRILPYLLRVRDEFRIPMLYVTHDRFEALALADEMVVMVGGKVAQAGPVDDLFSRPANLDVAGVLAVETVIRASIIKAEHGLTIVEAGASFLAAVDQDLPPGTREVYACIRAENVVLFKGPDSPTSARNHLAGTVRSLDSEGPLVRVELDCGFPLKALLTRRSCDEMNLKTGDSLTAQVKAQHVHLIAR